jgi:predicted N-acetyltransferase YhbS
MVMAEAYDQPLLTARQAALVRQYDAGMVATYRFSTDPQILDRPLVHRWLSESSYWAAGREREVQDRAMDGSRNYAVVRAADGRQVAYARVVTDGVTFAWLCDVIVDPTCRGDGVGKLLVEGLLADLEPLGLKRVVLATADAHGLYEQFGFRPLADPTMWMARGATDVPTPKQDAST